MSRASGCVSAVEGRRCVSWPRTSSPDKSILLSLIPVMGKLGSIVSPGFSTSQITARPFERTTDRTRRDLRPDVLCW